MRHTTEENLGSCLYKTGKCRNKRAVKANGQLHNLCELHRIRQNRNQRRLDAKNRDKRSRLSTKPSLPKSTQWVNAPSKLETHVLHRLVSILDTNSGNSMGKCESFSGPMRLPDLKTVLCRNEITQ